MRRSPSRLLRSPRVNGRLPSMLAMRRVSALVNDVSQDAQRKRHGQTVLRALCDYKLHISRLYGLGLSSLCLGRGFVGMRNGKDGRHLIPVSSHTVHRLRLCFPSHGRKLVGPKCRSFMFVDHFKGGVSHVVIFRVVGRLTRRAKLGGAVDPRAFHRSFTARLLRKKTGLHTVRYVLKRRDVNAARVCARLSHDQLQRRVLRRRPEGQLGG